MVQDIDGHVFVAIFKFICQYVLLACIVEKTDALLGKHIHLATWDWLRVSFSNGVEFAIVDA